MLGIPTKDYPTVLLSRLSRIGKRQDSGIIGGSLATIALFFLSFWFLSLVSGLSLAFSLAFNTKVVDSYD